MCVSHSASVYIRGLPRPSWLDCSRMAVGGRGGGVVEGKQTQEQLHTEFSLQLLTLLFSLHYTHVLLWNAPCVCVSSLDFVECVLAEVSSVVLGCAWPAGHGAVGQHQGVIQSKCFV